MGRKDALMAREVKGDLVHEINTLEELRELDHHSSQLNSDILSLIGEVLDCRTEEDRGDPCIEERNDEPVVSVYLSGKTLYCPYPGGGNRKNDQPQAGI